MSPPDEGPQETCQEQSAVPPADPCRGAGSPGSLLASENCPNQARQELDVIEDDGIVDDESKKDCDDGQGPMTMRPEKPGPQRNQP